MVFAVVRGILLDVCYSCTNTCNIKYEHIKLLNIVVVGDVVAVSQLMNATVLVYQQLIMILWPVSVCLSVKWKFVLEFSPFTDTNV